MISILKLNRKNWILLSFLLVIFSIASAQNEIVLENTLQGNPASEWDISGAGDLTIQGFATEISANKGNRINFKIKTDASNYTINIYRLGYYQGNGARLVGAGTITATLPQLQPVENYDISTGKTDCGNWDTSAYWDIPANAVSGVYIAKLTRTDNNGSSHIVFIVRDDQGNSPILFKTSDATWQAYNVYGGSSLYVGSTPGYPQGHATKVSYNRPFITRNGGGGGGASEDWLFNAEYPMIRWLERNGYPVSYTTDLDMDKDPIGITPTGTGGTYNHKVFLSIGHDEYWSATQRTKIENARNAGVHMAFFSGNEVYWKTRWEDNNRTLVCYKEGTLGENACGSGCDPQPGWTGLWRDGNPAQYPGSDGFKPENTLTGQISWDATTSSIQVGESFKRYNFWRFTDVASLNAGGSITLPFGTLGYEWDYFQSAYADKYPANRVILSSTVVNNKTHNLSLYRHSGGALVFAAGTVQWSWGLDNNHDRGNLPASKDMQQATLNLLTDMGVQPGSVQSDLVTSAAIVDITPPSTNINVPLNATNVNAGEVFTITGTSTDDNGVVANVELSFDGGLQWVPVGGGSNWSYNHIPNTGGILNIRARAIDNNGNVEQTGALPSSNHITLNVINQPLSNSIFPSNSVPQLINANDGQPIELGVKFRTTENGLLKGIRFYKGAGDNGTHICHLWTSTGTLLAVDTFTNETPSGWQEVLFNNPVQVFANTTYVASYHSSSGFYSITNPFFTNAVVNGPIRALANGEDGPNGVYSYTQNPAFPTSNFQSSNYWVDVLFFSSGIDITPPSVISSSPYSNSQTVSLNTVFSVTFNEAIDTTLFGSNTFLVTNGGSPVNGSLNYSGNTLSFQPSQPLANSTTYTVTINSATIKDSSGNQLPENYSWSFTTVGPPPPPPTEGTGGPILVISSTSNPFSRYTVEMLRAEGLNEFDAVDVSAVTPALLNNHDVVLLGEMAISPSLLTNLTNFVNGGGTLISFRPNGSLYPLLGISSANAILKDKYLLIKQTGAGLGIVNQTIQFHGTADLYMLNGATSLANLYSSATTPTSYPAVSSRNVGTNGGVAIAFAFDLPKSIVYTRQGNPAWAGQSRDGQAGPIRSDNLFFPDWIDFDKIAIPQADEQLHFLNNLIIRSNLHRKPLPKFWFLPRKLKAAIVMTGDDHGSGNTVGRFNQFLAYGNNSSTDVLDWKAVRGSAYIYSSTSTSTISNIQAMSYEAQGFEIAAHLTTNCENFSSAANLESFYTPQLVEFGNKWPGLSSPVTNRTHCIAWSDWGSQFKVELAKGIRLDVNYYYWPQSWMNNRPGMFTGSGMPMRFADTDGSLFDIYQVPTQMTDETNMDYTAFCNALLDKAIGKEGYYGVFAANMHNDAVTAPGADLIIASALQRQIPVISSKQMLTWLDGRNSSRVDSINWNGNKLTFKMSLAGGAYKLQGMLPINSENGQLTNITLNGAEVTFTTEKIKGIYYAFFDGSTGDYEAIYNQDNNPPQISNITVSAGIDGNATISWNTDKLATSKIFYGIGTNPLRSTKDKDTLVINHTLILTDLQPGITYHFRIGSTGVNEKEAISPAAPDSLAFTIPGAPCAIDDLRSDFEAGAIDQNLIIISDNGGSVTLKPAIYEEFSGTSVPTGFANEIWNGQAGAITTFGGGLAIVDGSHLYSQNSYSPGTSIEFFAKFTPGSFQNIGFSTDGDFNSPWVTIGIGNEGNGTIYARNSIGQTVSLGNNLMNNFHSYKIQWRSGTNDFLFYVDDILIPTPGLSITVGSNMVIQISDFPAGGVDLSIDWLRITPYANSGNFESRIFDAGNEGSWLAANWQSSIPSNTNLNLFIRKGDTPLPDQSWTSFTPYIEGDTIGSFGRYIQYKAVLSTNDPSVTPMLNRFSISCTQESNQNNLPQVSNISFIIKEDSSISLRKNEFSTAFLNPTNDSLQSVIFTSLPNHGVLTYNGIPVSVNQEIMIHINDILRYDPILNFNGNDTIIWNGSAKQGYANNDALILIQATPVNDAPIISIASPVNSASFSAGNNITVKTNVNDPDNNLLKVEYFLVSNPTVKLAEVTTAPFEVTGQQVEPGIYPVYARAIDDSGAIAFSDTTIVTVTACTGSGSILGEGYSNIPGTQVADMTSNPAYPDNPSITAQLNVFEYSNMGNNYGGRLRGYICAPVTGNYTFYIAGDDQAGLFLSTDENPANKVLIAYNVNPVGFRAWTTVATQRSAPVRLIKGARYYIETQHKQSSGTNHMSVGWDLPNGVAERPIAGTRLSPYLVAGPGSQPNSRSFAEAMQIDNAKSNELSVMVYPNPSRNYFTISTESNSLEPLSISIIDVTGRVVERKDKLNSNGVVQMGSNLRQGIYFIEVLQGTERKMTKVIKQ